MKINDLISEFTIAMSNEEKKLYNSIKGAMPLESFDERDQTIMNNLIRKSLVSKVHTNGYTLVIQNGQQITNK
jgi:hypothetical protein